MSAETRPGGGRGLVSGVRGRLLALVLVGAVPVVGIALANALAEHRAAFAEVTRAATLLREAGAARQVAALDTTEAVLRGLADDPRARPSDPEGCEAAMRDALRLFPQRFTGFWVVDAEGRLVCSTATASRGRSFADQDYFVAVRASGDFALGGFTVGPVTGLPVLQAGAPIRGEGGAIEGVVGAALRLDWLSRPSRYEAKTPHSAWLLDGQGRPLPIAGADAGALPPPELLARLAGGDTELDGRAAGGARTAWASASVSGPLRLLVAVDVEGAASRAQARLYRRLAELWLFVLACVLAILAGAELACSRPLRRLAREVQGWRPGRPLSPAPSVWDPWEVRALNAALSDAAAAIESNRGELGEALRKREVMLEEIHHRVKNNLQVVASLLSLQAGRVAEPAVRAELLVARERVQALAVLHRNMEVRDAAVVVPLAPLLAEMCGPFVQALRADDGLSVRVEAADLVLPAEQAASVTLFVSEALTNAVRHAFPAGGAGRVAVRLAREGCDAALEVADDGVGAGEQPGLGESVGLSLMRGFAAHLGGTFDIEPNPLGRGTRAVLRFPVAPYPSASGASSLTLEHGAADGGAPYPSASGASSLT